MRRVMVSATILVFVMFMLALPLNASQQEIKVFPELYSQVNSETLGNQIPWFEETAEYLVKIEGVLSNESILVSIIKGEWSHNLYKFNYRIIEVLEGDCREKEVSFFIEHRFPAPGSRILVKELWPFHKDKALIFKIVPKTNKNLIVSIEQQTIDIK